MQAMGEVKFTKEGVPYLSSLPTPVPVPNEQLDAVLKARASSFAATEGQQPRGAGRDIILVVFNRGEYCN